MKRGKRNLLLAAWRIARPYWTSEEKWSAWGLLLTVIALSLGNVYISVLLNQWNNAFYNTLQTFDGPGFFREIGIFCVLAGISIVMSVYALYLNQMLQIRWRRWLTRKYLGAWLDHRAYYRLQLQNTGGPSASDLPIADNPDQRISEDLNQFTTYVLSLSLGLLTSVVSLASFLMILWALSGPAAIPLGKWGTLYIPGYLVWAALIYAGAGTWLTVKIGRPLVSLNFLRQRFEADFRFSLVRLRENAEGIAFYGGESVERDVLHERFQDIFVNFWRIMKRQKSLTWFTVGYAQIAIIFPVLVVAPRYFAKQIGLGGLMQVINAFSTVQSSLSFIITSYTDIAVWQAVTERLAGFEGRLSDIQSATKGPQKLLTRYGTNRLALENVNVDLPDGTRLLRNFSLNACAGERVLITGPSGGGKSTLLRVVAGLWPFGRGTIDLCDRKILFLPQRPYLPLGTLARALAYPRDSESSYSTVQLRDALETVGLGPLEDKLDIADDWSQRLSLGEQQRLAFARILLATPNLVFLDEATSALDESSEAELYDILCAAPWRPIVISVGHRSTLRRFHDQVIDLAPFNERFAKEDACSVA